MKSPWKSRKSGGFLCTAVVLLLIFTTIFWINLEDDLSALNRRKRLVFRRLCSGKRFFIYELPSRFNRDFFDSCRGEKGDVCDLYGNSGLGQPFSVEEIQVFGGKVDWWSTLPTALEVIFHHRLLNHVCRTSDKEEADFFYVPFYATLDLHLKLAQGASKQELDSLPQELAQWLRKQARFVRYNGSDHFTVLGSPTWVFRNNKEENWGSGLEFVAEFENMLKLEVEKFPYSPVRAVGVPYPTSFHPSGDNVVRDWQKTVRKSTRKYKWSFLALGEAQGDEFTATRNELVKQCKASSNCLFKNCSNEEGLGCSLQDRMNLYLNSTFTVVHKSPHYFTQRAVFESILGGAIPIFLYRHTAYSQYTWHLPANPDAFSFYIPNEDLPTWSKVDRQLSKISGKRVKQMQEMVVKLIPQISYSHPWNTFGHQSDAVDVALNKMAKANSGRKWEEDLRWKDIEETAEEEVVVDVVTEGNTGAEKLSDLKGIAPDALESSEDYVEFGFDFEYLSKVPPKKRSGRRQKAEVSRTLGNMQ